MKKTGLLAGCKALFLFSLLVVGAAAMTAAAAHAAAKAPKYPSGNLDFVAPAGAGGGWDLTIRTVAKVLGDTRIVTVPMPVRNAPGAGGAVHLSTLQTKRDNANTITVYSPPILF
ncbi:MAG: hypothetical protein IJV64_09020, partial [Oscillospiraceae bacterium]|nr:hypothetical protein [Oscillospiraceae bacterium]